MRTLLIESFATGYKLLVLGAYVVAKVRGREPIDLAGSFWLIDRAKASYLRTNADRQDVV